jgi:hypothetical protein
VAGAKENAIGGIFGVALAAAGIWFYFGGGVEHEAAREMGQIEDQVAADSVVQYGIAKRNGSAIDVCVQAGMVSAAYLQAKDEPHYRQWKKTEDDDCKKAGMPAP